MSEPDLSSLATAQAAVVRAWGLVLDAKQASGAARHRAAALIGTPCARWRHLHLESARRLLEIIDDMWPILHDSLRAMLLEQRIASWQDAKLWADISARLEAERERFFT